MDPSPSDALGRPLRDLRISVTDRCNFRCSYCMPREVFHDGYRFLPKRELLRFEEIDRLARHFVSLGVEKIRLTGGEPLLRRELPGLVARLSAIPGLRDLTLTTNGYLLRDHAAALAAAGLHRLTISLDALDPETFAREAGAERDVSRVLEGIAAAEAVGLSPLKLNCVVRRGRNEHAMAELVEHFRGTPHVVRFIEYMDVGTLNGWRGNDVVPADEILERLRALGPLTPLPANYPGEVARRYQYADGSEVGIIASVSDPFCGDCTRARLSADGRLVTCLFAAGGRDLVAPLRDGIDDDALHTLLAETWRGRADRYSEQRAEQRASTADRKRLEMYQIGG